MPYRDDRDALDAKLRGLLQARRELDAEIADTYRALVIHRASAKARLVRGATWIAGLVVAGVATLAAVVVLALVSVPRYEPSRVDSARSDAATVRGAVEMYLAERPGGQCPDVATLVWGGFLSSSARVTDPWDNPYAIDCDGMSATVTSAGPDGHFGTEDDLHSY